MQGIKETLSRYLFRCLILQIRSCDDDWIFGQFLWTSILLSLICACSPMLTVTYLFTWSSIGSIHTSPSTSACWGASFGDSIDSCLERLAVTWTKGLRYDSSVQKGSVNRSYLLHPLYQSAHESRPFLFGKASWQGGFSQHSGWWHWSDRGYSKSLVFFIGWPS